MLQANPSLTPNQVKAILQYTSEVHPAYNPLTQGAGFLNAKGAVELARFLRAPAVPYPSSSRWAARLVWGNHLVRGGRLTADANAWSTNVTWGAAPTAAGQHIDWGVICSTANCVAGSGTPNRWGADLRQQHVQQRHLGRGHSQNVVWGSTCGGADCSGPWTIGVTGYPLSGTEGAAVVWGTTNGAAVVWGTSCSDPSCEPVIWNNP